MTREQVNYQTLRALPFIALAIALSGCGETSPRRYAIKGTVTLNGQSVSNATLILTPTGEGLAAAATIRNGVFELPAEVGPTAGEFYVRINPNEGETEDAPRSMRPSKASPRPKIPSIYQRNGALKTEVTNASNQTFDFDLKSK
jgi:hypothetical protein